MMLYAGLFRLGLLMLLSPKYALETSRCTGESFDSVLCRDGRLIKVTSATYGCMFGYHCPYNIDPGQDCREAVQREYLKEIKLKCDNRDTCELLRAERHIISCWWIGWPWLESDYVTIKYNCISPPEQTTSTTVYTTALSQTSNPEITSHVTTEYTRGDVTTEYTRSHVTTEYTSPYPADNAFMDHGHISTGLVLGCTLAVVGVVVVIVVTVVITNKQRNKGEASNHANSSSQPPHASTQILPTVSGNDYTLVGVVNDLNDHCDLNPETGELWVSTDDPPEYSSIVAKDKPSQTHDHGSVCNPVYSNISASDADLTVNDCPEYDLATATDEYSVVEKRDVGNADYNNVTFVPEMSERANDHILPGGEEDMEMVENAKYTPWDGNH